MRHLELTSLLILINTRENIKGLNSRILLFLTVELFLIYQILPWWFFVFKEGGVDKQFGRLPDLSAASPTIFIAAKKQKGKNATSLMMKERWEHIRQPGTNRVLVMFSAIRKDPLMVWSESQQFWLSLLGAKNWIAQVSEKWELICIVQRHLPIPFI